MNDRKITYIDLNGLKYFAEELKQYLEGHVLEFSIFNELKGRIEAVENQDFYKVVDELPEKGVEKLIYLVYNEDNENFLEYIWKGDKYEQLGSFTPQLSLDQYLKVEDSSFEKGDAEHSAVLKGGNNEATNDNEIALGQYNKSNNGTQFSIGMGTSDTDRKNAHEIMQDGKHYIIDVGGYDGTNPTDSEDVASAIKDLVAISYAELVNLKSNSKLVRGRFYRITDYITTTTQANTQSAGHPFDVIVLALSDSELSEQAWAVHSERDTDGYFYNSKLSAWKIWYCLNNDTSRFEWTVPTRDGGKGVIYRMIDEWNNDCPYDFKNIMFKHPSNPETYSAYYYTFSTVVSKVTRDHSLNGRYCHGNKIGHYVSLEMQSLNCIVFINDLGDDCYNNSFGNNCYSNSFSNDCYNNSFGNDCYNNSFGRYFRFNSLNNNFYNNSFVDNNSGNSFGNYCSGNSFGNYCQKNSFGNYCFNNKFGDDYRENSFGNNCYNNSFGNKCYNNSFGNKCYNNSFGNNFGYNSFNNDCHSNVFSNNCTNNSFDNSCHDNHFGHTCYNNSFSNSCYGNSFDNDCKSNSFGNNCHDNSFGSECYNNSFGNECYSNSFGNNCRINIFGNSCYSNTFEKGFYNNTFGNTCYNNIFGNDCNTNTFGSNCRNNTFGYNSHNNTLGSACHTNTFGHTCRVNSFGNTCNNNTFETNNNNICLGSGCKNNTFGNYCRNIKVAKEVSYCKLVNNETASSNNQIQYYKLTSGISGSKSSPLSINVTRNNSYETTVAKDTSGNVKQFCIADIIQ